MAPECTLTRRQFARIAVIGGLVNRVFASGFEAWAAPVSLEDSHKPKTSSRKSLPESVDGPASLKAHGAAAGLQVGCAVVPELLDLTPASTDPYTHTVVEQAGILVAENAMKWSSLRPSPTAFAFEAAGTLGQRGRAEA